MVVGCFAESGIADMIVVEGDLEVAEPSDGTIACPSASVVIGGADDINAGDDDDDDDG